MSLWSKIKNKLGINRKFLGGVLYINGEAISSKTFEFQEDVHYVYHKNTQKFQLLVELEYRFSWKKNGNTLKSKVACPLGFLWDGASIPEMFQGLIGGKFEPEFALASCIHDKAVDSDLDHYPESRIFYEILKTRKGRFNIPSWKEKAMYIAVYSWSVYSA